MALVKANAGWLLHHNLDGQKIVRTPGLSGEIANSIHDSDFFEKDSELDCFVVELRASPLGFYPDLICLDGHHGFVFSKTRAREAEIKTMDSYNLYNESGSTRFILCGA